MKEGREEVRYREDESKRPTQGFFFSSSLNIFIGFFHLNDFSFILAIALPPRCNCILKTQRKNTYFTEFFTWQTERGTLREIDRGRQIALTGERESRKFIVTLRIRNHTVVLQCPKNEEPGGSFKRDACSNSKLSFFPVGISALQLFATCYKSSSNPRRYWFAGQNMSKHVGENQVIFSPQMSRLHAL